jgi:tetratricopeptide (TPR) repeat protein/transglutaminase-like putative cysteine protease
MSIHRLIPFLLGALALVAADPLLAAPASSPPEPWAGAPFHLAPKELLAATGGAPGKADADIQVFVHELGYQLDAAGLRRHTRHTVYKILTPDGIEDWAQVEQSYLPWYQEIPRFTVRVVTPDGKERGLDPKTIADSPAAQEPELLDDERILRAPLPAVAVGSVVELVVEVVDRRPYFDAGTVTRASLELGVPVSIARVTLEAPRELPLRHRIEGLPGIAARLEGTDRLQRIFVEARNLPGNYPWWFPNLPPEAPRGPAVTFSTGQSWSAVAKSYSEVVDQQIAAPRFGGFEELGGPTESQQDEIRRLLERVHREVRYTGVELGDAGLVPRAPGDTVERRFGDCKDKAALVVALLRDRGIPAYVALLNAGQGAEVPAQLPGIGLFNHAIVYVPGSPALWIDATDPLSRLGQLPAADQGRLALVASPTTRDLVRIPVASAEDNRTVEVREVELPLLGNGRVVETAELHGEPARELRSAWLDATAEDIGQGLETYIDNAYRAETLVSHDEADSRDVSRPMSSRLEAAEAGLVVSDPDQAVVVVPLGSMFQGLPDALLEEPEESEEPAEAEEAQPARTEDWSLPYRFRREWTYQVTVPSNLEPRALPKDETVLLGPAVLLKRYDGEPGRVTARFRFEIDRERLTAAEGEALRAAIGKVENVVLWFDQKIAVALQAGRLGEALAEAGRLEGEFPDNAFPSIQRSRALLAAGFGEEAQKAALRATEIEPGSGAAFHQLGWARQHDALGRRLESGGYDRPGAIAALEKAIELEPENAVFRAELAIQLEYDALGGRYSTGTEDLARAIELYQKLEDELDNKNLAPNLLVTLARAGRWPEVLTRTEKLGNSTTGATWKVAAKAALEGADVAIAEAGRQLSDVAQRSKALASAGDELARERRYEDVSKLLSAASRLGAGSPELLGRAQLFARARPVSWDRIERAETPEAAFWSIFALFFGPSLGLDDLAQSLTPAQRSRPIDDEDRAQLAQLREEMRRSAAAQGLPVEVLADMIRAVAELTIEPDPSGDVRISTRLGNQEPLTVIAVPADGAFLVVPGDLSSYAYEARWHAERGQLEAARRYLDWALEEVAPTHPKDPLSGSPFALVWQKGRETDVDGLRLAGAVGAVLAKHEVDGRDVEELDRLRPLARTSAEQLAVAWAQVVARLHLEQPAAAIDDSARLLAAHPDSETALGLALEIYGDAGRLDELAKLGEARLERKPGDPWGLRFLARAEGQRGRYAEALGHAERLLATGRTLPNDYNYSAWLRLFLARVDDLALDHAQRAVKSEEVPSYQALHTLAAAYAAAGRTNEAYTTLKQRVDAAEDGQIASDDWYVLARMAETYGLATLAKELYARIPQPEATEGLLSTWHLARQRVSALP